MSRGLCSIGFGAWEPTFTRAEVCNACLAERGRCEEAEKDLDLTMARRRREMIRSIGMRDYNRWKPI